MNRFRIGYDGSKDALVIYTDTGKGYEKAYEFYYIQLEGDEEALYLHCEVIEIIRDLIANGFELAY